MKILVAYASKHGSTEEIALFIAKVLAIHGIEVDAKEVSNIKNLNEYESVIIGSAVYAGNWLKPAREFIDNFSNELSQMPVWLFSSGPIGKIPLPEKAVKIDEQIAKSGAREHMLFGGNIDKSQLNFAEKAILYAVKAGNGDSRDWDDIERWTCDISYALAGSRELVKEKLLQTI